jgi:hypothetical protein
LTPLGWYQFVEFSLAPGIQQLLDKSLDAARLPIHHKLAVVGLASAFALQSTTTRQHVNLLALVVCESAREDKTLFGA